MPRWVGYKSELVVSHTIGLLRGMLVKMLLLVLTIIVQVAWATVYYVKPSNSSLSECPDQPCLTLNEYTSSTSNYFTGESTFIFLSGYHSSEASICLNDTHNITLRGSSSDSPATVLCNIQYALVLKNVSHCSVKWLRFDLRGNRWLAVDTSERWPTTDPREYSDEFAAVLKIFNSTQVFVTNCVFLSGPNIKGRAIFIEKSDIAINRSAFRGHTAGRGGAVYASISKLILTGNVFTENRAWYFGGAVYLSIDTTAELVLDMFSDNSATFGGGALHCFQCNMDIKGNSTFRRNVVNESDKDCKGGALYSEYGLLNISGTVTFSLNSAVEGGAIFLDDSAVKFNRRAVIFSHNSAKKGGGMSLVRTSVKTYTPISFFHNVAEDLGGGISIGPNFVSECEVDITAVFRENTAGCGGAIAVYKEYSVTFTNSNVFNNSGSAVCVSNSRLTFRGVTRFFDNLGAFGGGIKSNDSNLTFVGRTYFARNSARVGGAIRAIQGTVFFSGFAELAYNSAESDGGAIYALGSNIIVNSTMRLNSNIATNGGAMYFWSSAFLTLNSITRIESLNNTAREYGGVIFHKDTPTTEQCNFTLSKGQLLSLPYCFLQTQSFAFVVGQIQSSQDSAGFYGNFLYGGLLDKCRLQNGQSTGYERLLFALSASEPLIMSNVISSQAYTLCICNSTEDYCQYITQSMTIDVYRGEIFSLPLLAIAQGGVHVSTRVTAITHGSRLRTSQNSQVLPAHCSPLTYSLYSTEDQEQLVLYSDSACRDSGLAEITVHVTFRACPEAFARSGEACACEERLRPYEVDCIIGEHVVIAKRSGSNFWMSVL